MINITRDDKLTVLPLSTRSFNCLNNVGIKTINDLLLYASNNDLYNIPKMGEKSVKEIQNYIYRIKTQLNDNIVNNNENFQKKFLKNNDDGNIIEDIFIEDISIPNRAKRSLKNANINYVSELLNKNLEDLLALKNMGGKTAEIVLSEISKLRIKYSVLSDNAKSINQQAADKFIKLASELVNCFGKNIEFWKSKIFNIHKRNPSAVGETVIYYLYQDVSVRSFLKNYIIKILSKNNDKISKKILEECLPEHLYNTTIFDEILIEMEMNNDIEIVGLVIFRKYPSVFDFLNQITDIRKRDFLLEKLKGNTLAGIGEKFGITRERVRQIINKILKRRPKLKEDKYFYLYNNYNFSEDDFSLAFNEPIEVYNYLELISTITRKLRKNIDENLLIDNNISVELRKLSEKVVYKDFIFLDGIYIKKNRSVLAQYIIKKYCKEVTNFDDFIELYKIQLEELELQNDVSLHIEARTYENKIMAADFVLWNLGRKFRYYNIKEKDFDDLISTISLDNYKDIEISTLKFFRDYPKLMEEYDIHDEYELHNLLKKIWPAEKDNVVFNRMPTIEIGTIDRDEQVLELLLQYSPISAENLAIKYEDVYGIKAATVLANYLANFDTYYYDGFFSIAYDNLPLFQYEHMKKILTEPFYLITDIRKIFLREYPKADANLINAYVLKTLNFRVYSGYVIKNSYANALDYFKEILTKDDITDTRNFNKHLNNIATYLTVLYKLRNSYEIIEFSPRQYINIRKLKEKGITVDKLKKYTKLIARFYELGDFFTIHSLRKKGFVHEFDDLGFDEWFYSSILLENKELFSYQRIGGTRLFLRGNGNAQISNMLKWLLESKKKIDLYDLIELLKNEFNIILKKEKIIEIIKETELYYDTIMETIYIDYDTYFEEI